MILPIFILLLISFLQVTFLSFDLILILLICRHFTGDDRENYYLAFGFGLLISFLSGQDLGFLSIIYLLALKIASMIRTSTLASSWFFILPIIFIIILAVEFLKELLFNLQFNLQNIILSMIVVLPVYYFIKIWEERFIPQKDLRLKLK